MEWVKLPPVSERIFSVMHTGKCKEGHSPNKTVSPDPESILSFLGRNGQEVLSLFRYPDNNLSAFNCLILYVWMVYESSVIHS